jgi:RND family efflux transporter MFP subunit
MLEPWTRDGTVRADVVGVAPDVEGLVTDVLAHDTLQVRQGDVLFRIDRDRFDLALREASANVENLLAAFEEADREMRRNLELTNLSVSREVQQQSAAKAAEAQAAYKQAVAARDTAQLNLDRSEVKASVNGILTNFSLRPGDYVHTGQAVAALVDTDSFFVEGYFEETKIPRIHPSDHALVRLMGSPHVMHGHVVGFAGGVVYPDRSVAPDLLPMVNPSFTWVRLAQRIPVRVDLDEVPPGERLIAGRTATVVILPR